MGFSLDDYVDVAERIEKFYEKHPDGSLVTVKVEQMEMAGQLFVVAHAKAFRSPDDKLPGDGVAWEPVPGKTPYTKDSELMNAQTAAWGRAIVATGILANKKIASKQEVQARQQPEQKGLPDRYVDCLRLAIRFYDANELADDAAWDQMVGAASTPAEKKQLVGELEAALTDAGGDPAKVKERWETDQAKKAAA